MIDLYYIARLSLQFHQAVEELAHFPDRDAAFEGGGLALQSDETRAIRGRFFRPLFLAVIFQFPS